MPRKKNNSSKSGNSDVAKIDQEVHEMKKSKAVALAEGNGRLATVLDLVDRITQAEPATTSIGKFPKLWAQTREALNQELQNQKAISQDMVRIAQKSTDLLRVSRDNAVENLLNLIADLESHGHITIPQA
jgi:hypothetical protein